MKRNIITNLDIQTKGLEYGLEIISIDGKGVRAKVGFKCVCGMVQTHKWLEILDGINGKQNWCHNWNCTHYRRLKKLTTEIFKQWLNIEGYSFSDTFEYIGGGKSFFQKYEMNCPNNHSFSASADNWVHGTRCKICNGDGRTLSYQEIKDFYAKYNCTLIYTEAEYKANVTNNFVSYRCLNGHVIDNLTKNNFNTRINSKLNPCKVCQDASRNREEEFKKGQQTCLKRYGVRNPIQHKEFFHKQRQSALNKTVTMPSGKIYKVQGAEDKCIDILLKKYSEEDIDLENIPVIPYINPNTDKTCKYNPDIYLPKYNILIEVKSDYWLNYDKERNMAKFRGAVEAGYTLQLYLFGKREFIGVEEFNPSSFS